jgi:hypothetical protein
MLRHKGLAVFLLEKGAMKWLMRLSWTVFSIMLCCVSVGWTADQEAMEKDCRRRIRRPANSRTFNGLGCCSCIQSPSLNFSEENAEAGGWIEMFNGTDLTGWKVNPENPTSFRVQDGVLVVDGPRCHLFWVGDPANPEDEQFTSFHWHAKVKTMPKANSGLYFHTQYQDSGWPAAGFECQVNQTHKDPKKTGGLYAVDDVLDTSPVQDGEWYDYDIIVDGKQVVLKINGVVTTEWTEPEDWQPPKNMPGRRLSQGTFAIQAHDPESVVHFKELRVKRLP